VILTSEFPAARRVGKKVVAPRKEQISAVKTLLDIFE